MRALKMTGLGLLAVAEEGARGNAEWLSGLDRYGLLALGVVVFASVSFWFLRRDNASSAELRKELQRWQTEHLATLKESAALGQRMMIALEASTVAVTANTAALNTMARASDAQARALVDVRMGMSLDAADEAQAELAALRKETLELRRKVGPVATRKRGGSSHNSSSAEIPQG